MAIQFACPSCQQPIEVDDEWASQTVSCPYCRRVIRAPAHSTLELGAIPSASQPGSLPPEPPPASAVGSTPVAPPPPVPVGYLRDDRPDLREPATPGSNGFGNWSVVCGLLAWALVTIGALMMRPVVAPIVKGMPPHISQAEANQYFQRQIEKATAEDARVRAQLGWSVLLIIGAEAAGLVGIVFSIVGLTRVGQRKTSAVVGLIVAGLFLPGQCASFLFAMMA